MIKIFGVGPDGNEEEIGYIKNGNVYSSEGEMLGGVDYDEDEVYDADDYLTGWLEKNGVVMAQLDDEYSEAIGHVSSSGEMYLQIAEENEGPEYVGHLTGMEKLVEAAAALILFSDIEVLDAEDDLDLELDEL